MGSLGHLRSTQTHFLRLYAAILRCHRILPSVQMKEMGNSFARSEFEQHHPTDKLDDGQLRSFFVEWTKYLNMMVCQAKDQMKLAQAQSNSGTNNNNIKMGSFGQDLDMNIVQG